MVGAEITGEIPTETTKCNVHLKQQENDFTSTFCGSQNVLSHLNAETDNWSSRMTLESCCAEGRIEWKYCNCVAMRT